MTVRSQQMCVFHARTPHVSSVGRSGTAYPSMSTMIVAILHALGLIEPVPGLPPCETPWHWCGPDPRSVEASSWWEQDRALGAPFLNLVHVDATSRHQTIPAGPMASACISDMRASDGHSPSRLLLWGLRQGCDPTWCGRTYRCLVPVAMSALQARKDSVSVTLPEAMHGWPGGVPHGVATVSLHRVVPRHTHLAGEPGPRFVDCHMRATLQLHTRGSSSRASAGDGGAKPKVAGRRRPMTDDLAEKAHVRRMVAGLFDLALRRVHREASLNAARYRSRRQARTSHGIHCLDDVAELVAYGGFHRRIVPREETLPVVIESPSPAPPRRRTERRRLQERHGVSAAAATDHEAAVSPSPSARLQRRLRYRQRRHSQLDAHCHGPCPEETVSSLCADVSAGGTGGDGCHGSAPAAAADTSASGDIGHAPQCCMSRPYTRHAARVLGVPPCRDEVGGRRAPRRRAARQGDAADTGAAAAGTCRGSDATPASASKKAKRRRRKK